MKKCLSLILLLMMLFCGCAPSIEEEKPTELSEAELIRSEGQYLDAAGKEIPLEDVTADNWYKVRLTYPVNFMGEEDIALCKEEYEEVEVDENNRVSVVMSREQYEALKANSEAMIEDDFAACKDGSLAQLLPNITDIKTDELYEDIYVLISGDINKEQITPFAYLLCKDVYRFKILVGNNTKTTIIIMDAETEAVYGEFDDIQLYEYESKGGENDES